MRRLKGLQGVLGVSLKFPIPIILKCVSLRDVSHFETCLKGVSRSLRDAFFTVN
jgi:hypothetical protein